MIINQIIEEAVNSIPDTYYLRATDQEANIEIDEIDLHGLSICIYNNLPSITHEVTNSIIREWPVEIKILQLADYDDNDVDGDVIRDACLRIADQLHDIIVSDLRTSQAADIENYIIDMLDQVKLYDQILTGVNLRFMVPLTRNEC